MWTLLPALLSAAPLPDAAAQEIYWGALHEHSGLSRESYGFTADEVFARMADAGLDFGAVTDYDWALYGGTWGDAIAAADAAHCPGCAPAFVSLLGYEWNNNSYPSDGAPDAPEYGHRNVYLVPEGDADGAYPPDLPLLTSGEGWLGGEPGWTDWYHPCDLWSMLAALDGARGFTVPHHPALSVSGGEGVAEIGRDKPTATDWSIRPEDCGFGEAVEPLVEIYSVWGSSARADMGPEEDPVDGLADDARVVREIALGGGRRLGLIGAGDSHYGYPGRDPHHDHALQPDGAFRNYTFECALDADCDLRFGRTGLAGVVVDGPLTRASLVDALEARRTVATTGERYRLVTRLWVDGEAVALQGDALDWGAPSEATLEVEVELGGATLGRLEVLALGEDGAWVSHEVALDAALAAGAGTAEVPLVEGGARAGWLPAGDLLVYARLEAAPTPAIQIPEGAAPLRIDLEDGDTIELSLAPGGWSAAALTALDLSPLRLEYSDLRFSISGAPAHLRALDAPEIAYALGFRSDADTPPAGWCDPCEAAVEVDTGEVIERAWASPIWLGPGWLDAPDAGDSGDAPAGERGRCGCASGPVGGALWLVALALASRRR